MRRCSYEWSGSRRVSSEVMWMERRWCSPPPGAARSGHCAGPRCRGAEWKGWPVALAAGALSGIEVGAIAMNPSMGQLVLLGLSVALFAIGGAISLARLWSQAPALRLAA